MTARRATFAGEQPMTITRRAWLKGAGAVTILAAGGVVWRAHEQGVLSAGTGPAYEPWIDRKSVV